LAKLQEKDQQASATVMVQHPGRENRNDEETNSGVVEAGGEE